jgi:hypothetical protein
MFPTECLPRKSRIYTSHGIFTDIKDKGIRKEDYSMLSVQTKPVPIVTPQYQFFLELTDTIGGTVYESLESQVVTHMTCASILDSQRRDRMGVELLTVTITPDNLADLKAYKQKLLAINNWAAEFYLIHLFARIVNNTPLTVEEIEAMDNELHMTKEEILSLKALYPQLID